MPILEKGKQDDPGNYRPVRQTSIPDKIMEPLIPDPINKELKEGNIINANQAGFMENRPCQTNVIFF